jgi:hypothetical protein
MSDNIDKAILVAGAFASIAFFVFTLKIKLKNKKQKQIAQNKTQKQIAQNQAQNKTQQKQIDQLKLQLLALQTTDIQTLNGKSLRKEWIKQHAHHETWTSSLLKVQETNALCAPPRPHAAEDLGLYNAAEAGDLEEARSLLSKGYSPNHSKELHPKFGTTPLMEACTFSRRTHSITPRVIRH